MINKKLDSSHLLDDWYKFVNSAVHKDDVKVTKLSSPDALISPLSENSNLTTSRIISSEESKVHNGLKHRIGKVRPTEIWIG